MHTDPSRLELKRDLWVSNTPVTEQQWLSHFGQISESTLPITKVSYEEAFEFATSTKGPEGQACRLLTSEEWEYACRAGTDTVFHYGDSIDKSQANFLYSEEPEKIGPDGPTPVKSYPPNGYGLYDMHGNVCEWTSTHSQTGRIIRGGAWDYLPRLLRSSWWASLQPQTKRDNLGFRIAVEVK